MKLHAVYKQNHNNASWMATIKNHPYIRLENAPCLESAKMLLAKYVAEEMPKRCNWEIIAESVEYSTQGDVYER